MTKPCQHQNTYPTTIDWQITADDAIPYRVEQCADCPAYYDIAFDKWFDEERNELDEPRTTKSKNII